MANKTTDKIVKSQPVPEMNFENVEETDSTREKARNPKRIKTSNIKMEHHQISKLLNNSIVTRKWIRVNDISNGQYSVNKNIRFKTPILRSDLSAYSDEYIVVIEVIYILAAANENDKVQKDVVFKNNVPFRSCIPKINSTLKDNAEDLDIVMPMYNLLEYSDNYSMTSGSLRNYYKDEIDGVK